MKKINRKNLLNSLTKVKSGLVQNEIIEQTNSFIFKNGKVFTYNDEVCLSDNIDLDTEGVVPSKEFLHFISKVKKDEIEYEVKENELRLKAGRSRVGIVLDPEIKLPIDDFKEINKWKDLPDRKSTRLNSSHTVSSYAVFCLKKKKKYKKKTR